MAQSAIINQGTWGSLNYPVAESNLDIQGVKWKPSRDKVQRKSAANKAVSKLSYRNPTMTITLDAEVKALSTLGSLAVGRAPATMLANFDVVWREHENDEGVVVLEDVEDSAEVNADVPITTTMTFVHYPFVA
jgi:hypothetical protein